MALRLLREGHEARLERAACVHHADEAAQHEDEHHDVGGLHRARHHAHRDVGDAFGLLLQALVRVGNRDGLGQRARGELVDPDVHADSIERLLRGGLFAHRALGARDLKRARVGVVRELRVLARRHEPCSRHRDDGEREQDGEGGGEAELPLLLRRAFLGRGGAGGQYGFRRHALVPFRLPSSFRSAGSGRCLHRVARTSARAVLIWW